MSYNIPPGFLKTVSAHGNSKCKAPFYPTLPSTMELMREVLLNRSSGPKHTVGVVSKKVGGVMAASSASELPRNERQVTYLKGRASKSESSVGAVVADQVFAIMQQAKLEDHLGKFVRDCRPTPEPAFVLSRDRQLNDLVRFCTDPTNFCVLTVDPTFNLGDFDVTPTAYRNLLLKTERYGTHPVFIGPTLVHYRKTFGTYLFFASSLIGLRQDLLALQAFGTDGEKALANAFGHEFRYATHLSCFVHCRRNVKQELNDRKYPTTAMTTVLEDIFGKQQGDVFVEGLVDSVSEEEFDRKVAMLSAKWSEIESTSSQVSSGFHSWFVRYKADSIKSTMLKPVREQAGLGCPPEQFTTNQSEAINGVIKNQVGYKSHQLMDFVEHLKMVVDEQDHEIERAVIGRGKYRFDSAYAHLEVSPSKWFKMSEKQRQDHLAKVAKTKVSSTTSRITPPCSSQSVKSSKTLSVDVNRVAAKVSVPLECLVGIWQKAEELLQSPSDMSPAPGQPENARMVISRSGKRPHLVLPSKSGYKCDSDCLNFKSIGLCSHTVAVAECTDSLKEFLRHFEKSHKKPDFTSLALHDVPAGSGRKGSVPPRKRKKQEPITKRIDGLQDSANAGLPMSSDVPGPSGSSSSIGQVCGPSMVNISLDSHTLSSHYEPRSRYSSPSWYPNYYSWGCQPYCSSPYGQQSTLYGQSTAASPPMAEEDSPFKLHFICGNISKCAGCGNQYVKPAMPPYDLCIQHREWRSYTVGGNQQTKFAPAYYHVNTLCVTRKWPAFLPSQVSITPEVFSKLQGLHKQYLMQNGFM